MGLQKIHSKEFVSPNHTFYFENQKGLYLPKYLGRSSIDLWISENGGEINLQEKSSKLFANLKFKGVKYFFKINYENQRPIKKIDPFDLNKYIMSGNTMICDEHLEFSWRHRLNPNEEMMIKLREFGFQEIIA